MRMGSGRIGIGYSSFQADREAGTGCDHGWIGRKRGFSIFWWLLGCCIWFIAPARSVELYLVEDGEPRAVVVTADNPSAVAVYAVEELLEHVKLATGARLPVTTESELSEPYPHRIYIGLTGSAEQAGLAGRELGPDEFILRTLDGHLYIIGNEQAEADPLDEQNAFSGTLFGTYELLHRFVGVRWLWPGALGTLVPPQSTLTIPVLDLRVEPALRFRNFRWGRVKRAMRSYSATLKPLAFSEQGMQNYGRDLNIFLRRHRQGFSEPKPRVGHYFGSWWGRYGEDNPDWFAMDPNGQRGFGLPLTSRLVPICVSNPELHRYIVEQAWDGSDNLSLGEVDSGRFCHCPDCLAWDGPQPEGARSRIISDRYARFWKEIQAMAARRNPAVTVATFLYVDYFPAPLTDIELNQQIYGEFCPWGYNTIWFPASEERLEWGREQWRGWSETGITMGYRPNHTLAGYAMPHLNTRQAGEFLRFAYQSGLVGVDFDSLTGQWAVRGPENYMYLRLFADPELTVEQTRKEYFSGFGPAAELVEEYFDYWEEYNHELRRRGQWRNMYNHPGSAPDNYPEEVFPPAANILARALQVAQADRRDEFADRVGFLQAGLEHARLSARMIAHLRLSPDRYAADSELFSTARELLLERVPSFRRDHEDLYIADYERLAALEHRRYGDRIRQLGRAERADEMFDFDFSEDARNLQPLAGWDGASGFSFLHARVRGWADFVVYAEAGSQVTVRLDYQPVSRTPRPAPPVNLVVTASDGTIVHRAEILYQEENELVFTAPDDGLYRLAGNAGGHQLTVLASSHPVNLYTGQGRVHVRQGAGDYYFWVPAGTEDLSVHIAGRGQIERVQGKLIDPGGETVAHKDSVTDAGAWLTYEFPPEHEPVAGAVWNLRIMQPTEGRYFDQLFELKGVPPFLAASPNAVLRTVD